MRFFIDRAVLTHTIFLILIFLSILSYQRVAKELFPPSTLDKIMITGAYAGASSDTLNKIAVTPIEDRIKNYAEVSSVESVILNGSFSIVADIKPNNDLTSLLSDFKSEVSQIRSNLPSDMSEPSVSIVKKAFPLITVNITDDFDFENEAFQLLLKEMDKWGGCYFENFRKAPFKLKIFKEKTMKTRAISINE